MDILDKLITYAQISGSINVQCQFQGNWYVRHEHRLGQALVHIVTSGEGYVKTDDEAAPRLVRAGDIVFFPRLAAHILSNDKMCNNVQAATDTQQNGVFTLKTSTGKSDTELGLFCARFTYDAHADLMNTLPETIFLRLESPVLNGLLTLLQHESTQNEQGSRAVIDSLSSVLFVYLLRTYLAENANNAPLTGILNGWRDKRLRAVVQAVIATPEREWRVEELAQKATLSRAQLMRVFNQQMQTSPHAFVNAMRLQKAAHMLRTQQDTVLAIALATGFQSEAHFGKAFKKYYGTTPGQYRKTDIQVADNYDEYVI
ncbi:cupin domain-containing protein [Neisseriaceae bacterium B1]